MDDPCENTTCKGEILRASDRLHICSGIFRFAGLEIEGLKVNGPVMEIAEEDRLKPLVLDVLSSSEVLIIALENGREVSAACRYPDHFSGRYYLVNVEY